MKHTQTGKTVVATTSCVDRGELKGCGANPEEECHTPNGNQCSPHLARWDRYFEVIEPTYRSRDELLRSS